MRPGYRIDVDRVDRRAASRALRQRLNEIRAELYLGRLGLVMAKRIQIRGCTLRTRTLEEKLAATRRFATHVLPLLARGQIRPIIEQVYPLREIATAHRTMEENRNFGKLILSMDE